MAASEPIVHARLDPRARRVLQRLRRRTGLSDSELIRRGLFALDAEQQPLGVRIVGVGAFASGIGDLATNKRHLDGFGES